MSETNNPTNTPPANTPPAGAPPANTPPANTPPANTPPAEWTTGLNPEQMAFVQNKQFKDPVAVVESYRNLEKLTGVPQERLLKLPESTDDLAQVMPIFDKLGRPKDPKDYNFKPAAEGQALDEKTVEWARPLFHSLGLTKAQGEKLAAEFNTLQLSAVTAQKEAQQAELVKQQGELKKKWGSAFDQNVNVAKRAATAFGIDSEKLDQLESVMGFQGIMEFMHTLGSKVGEDSFVGGDSGGGAGNRVRTPGTAQQEISLLMRDKEFGAKLLAKDPHATKKWADLHKQAYPEQT